MKDECKNYIEAILADKAEPAARTHCAGCPECASLAADWERISNAAIPVGEVPLTLDFAVLAAADRTLRERRRRRVTIHRIIYYGAAAACVALACLVTIFPPDNHKNHQGMVKNWDWSKFDKELFETAAAIEISTHCISISGNSDTPPPNLPVIEEEQEQI